jgi:TonB family protein
MTARMLSYGAPELKRLGSAYLATGLGLSLLIHLCALSALVLLRPASIGTIMDAGPRFVPPWERPVRLLPQEPSAGPALPPSHHGPMKPGRSGTFVPVPEVLEDTSRVWQAGDGQGTDPAETGPYGGEGGGEGGPGPDAIDEPVPIELTEELPQVIVAKRPDYPEIAVKSDLTGRVVVKMLVDRWGKVKEAEVVASTAEVFNDCTLEAARGYLFRPAVMNKRPVPVWVMMPFVFRLASK